MKKWTGIVVIAGHESESESAWWNDDASLSSGLYYRQRRDKERIEEGMKWSGVECSAVKQSGRKEKKYSQGPDKTRDETG
jgi:hypothetical protein